MSSPTWFIRLSLSLLLLAPTLQAEEGIVAQKPAQLTALAEQVVATAKVPGATVRVIVKNEVVFDQGFGVTDAAATRPWDKDAPVFIASMSKSITATLTALLVAEDVLAFDDPIAKHLPSYAKLKHAKTGATLRSPTIAECLSHTSGMPGGTIKTLPKDSLVHSEDQAAVADLLAEQGLITEPGTRFAYTFRGYAAVARVIEVATGKDISTVFEEKLFTPLGMSSSTFTPKAELLAKSPRHAEFTEGKTTEQLTALLALKNARDGGFINTAGGLLSTADDLQRFYQFHADDGMVDDAQLLPADVLKQLYLGQPGAKGYGLGFKPAGAPHIIGHGGATGTFGAVDLNKNRILIVLTQAGSLAARPLIKGATDLVLPK